MASSGSAGSLLRVRKPHTHSKVTFVELFFDLVFVFAITQLSHSLLEHFTVGGAIQTAVMFLAVWWAWVYTSWVTNWLDPEVTAVKLMLLALMMAGLLLSTSLPKAFESTGLIFGGAYAFIQVGRSLFMLWALKGGANASNLRNFQRITTWLSFSGLLWIGGGFAEGDVRLMLWIVALAIEYAGPAAGFFVPGLGRSHTDDWDVEGAHMAERCGLFVIIALGESILVTGATFYGLEWTAGAIAAFVVAFIGTAAMWWIYFDTGHERGSHRIAEASDPGRLARLAYTYIHLVIVAGIILCAVSDEFLLAHPDYPAGGKAIAAIVGGPALYLLGNILFKRVIAGRLPLSHLVGLALLTLLMPVATSMNQLALGAASTVVLVVVAVWETRSLRPQTGRHTPSH